MSYPHIFDKNGFHSHATKSDPRNDDKEYILWTLYILEQWFLVPDGNWAHGTASGTYLLAPHKRRVMIPKGHLLDVEDLKHHQLDLVPSVPQQDQDSLQHQ